MMKMKKICGIAAIVLALALVFSACGSGDNGSASSADAANAVIDKNFGVGGLAWGEKADALFTAENVGSLKLMQYGAQYAGYVGTLYYSFDENGGMYAAYYEFNTNGTSDPVEIYKELMATLTEEYGHAEQMMVNDENGNAIPAPGINDVAAGKQSGCTDMWNNVPAPEGSRVSATLQLHDDGKITLSFYMMAA